MEWVVYKEGQHYFECVNHKNTYKYGVTFNLNEPYYNNKRIYVVYICIEHKIYIKPRDTKNEMK